MINRVSRWLKRLVKGPQYRFLLTVSVGSFVDQHDILADNLVQAQEKSAYIIASRASVYRCAIKLNGGDSIDVEIEGKEKLW